MTKTLVAEAEQAAAPTSAATLAGVTLRPGRPEDAAPCGRICYSAFKTLSEYHRFPPDFPSPETATQLLSWLLAHPKFYSVVAEVDGKVVGSNFLDERGTIAGVGPITIDPSTQNQSIGRQLMLNVLDRAGKLNSPGVRLVQATYHSRSLCLYSKLGFVVQELLATMQGQALGFRIPGHKVRKATKGDLEACNRLCLQVHGHERGEELIDGISQGSATVVEHEERITGYATSIGFFGHAVGQTNEDLKALIGAAKQFAGPGFLLPTRNSELFRWCLEHGLRVVQPMTLMNLGLYNEPRGIFLPSVLF